VHRYTSIILGCIKSHNSYTNPVEKNTANFLHNKIIVGNAIFSVRQSYQLACLTRNFICTVTIQYSKTHQLSSTAKKAKENTIVSV